ncbi:hypothetical protein DIZ27_13275 [Streptomyces sp. NWU339]|nr:hypothetical protein DIZ27_13275 [Streptomyces sp. NWU339]
MGSCPSSFQQGGGGTTASESALIGFGQSLAGPEYQVHANAGNPVGSERATKPDGADAARAVARHLVVFLARPGGQSQFSVRARIGRPGTPALRTVLDLLPENPAAEHTLGSLARQVGLSPRHLTRLFRAETDTSPARFVEQVRLEAACTLLVTGTDPLDAVARPAGFGSPETMRRVFQRELGVTPGAYRTRFSTTAGSAHRHIPNA